MDDTRKHPRVPASRIVLRVSSPERLRQLYLRDLSLGGLFVKTDKRFPMGTVLTVELWPPEWKEPLVFDASVIRWQEEAGENPQGMGMKFGKLEADVREKLAKLVEEHGKVPPEQDEFVEKHVKDLIGELDLARQHIVALEKQLEKERAERSELEKDEADVRSLADKLATDKSALDRRSKEEIAAATNLIEELKSDQKRLDLELGRLKAENSRLQETAKKDAQKAAAAEDELRRSLSEQSAETALHRQRADSLADEVEKRRTKERDLRKLLAAIGAGSTADSLKEAVKATADETPDSLTIEDAPSNRSSPPPPPSDVEVAKPSDVPPSEDDDNWEESIDLATTEADEDFFAFQQRLKNTTRLVAADKLRSRTSKGDEERLVIELLQAGPTFQTLLNQIGAKVPEATLHRLLFDLHSASMIELQG
jgi:uncharacterized protein (TIGR02266 family)